MKRFTAIFLFLFALAGTFVPLATAVTTTAPHACCRRRAHQCHDSAVTSSGLAVHGTNCCNHDCCRTASVSQKAHALPQLAVRFALQVQARVTELLPAASTFESFVSRSPRAPPRIALA
jgi:hypothetical protein